jgi:heat shock protein HslJ
MTLFNVAFTVWLGTLSFTAAETVDGVEWGHASRGIGTIAVPTSAAAGLQVNGGNREPSNQVVQRPSENLPGTAWNAVDVNGTAVPADPGGQDRRPHLVFGEDGRLSGADGCNRLAGPYSVRADEVSFGQLVATRMACPATDDLARRFQEALNDVSRWRIVQGRLELSGANGKPLIVFERRPAR